MNLYFSVGLWYLSSTCITIFYRAIGYYKISGFIGSSSLILQSVFACLYTRKLPKFINSVPQLLSIFSLGMYILLSNISLQYIPIHVAVMFKCLIPIFSILFAKFGQLEFPEHHIISNLIYLTIGIILSNIKEEYENTTIIGYLLALSTCFFAGLKFTSLKMYLEDTDPIIVLKDTGIYMGLFTLPIGILQIFQVIQVIQSINILEISLFISLFITIGTLLGFCISLFEYTVIKEISIWETILFDTLKEVLLIIGSSFFDNKLGIVNWLGIIIVITTIISLKYHIYLKERPLEI